MKRADTEPHRADTSDVFQVLKVSMKYMCAHKMVSVPPLSVEVCSIELTEPTEGFRIFQNRYTYIRYTQNTFKLLKMLVNFSIAIAIANVTRLRTQQ